MLQRFAGVFDWAETRVELFWVGAGANSGSYFLTEKSLLKNLMRSLDFTFLVLTYKLQQPFSYYNTKLYLQSYFSRSRFSLWT